MTTAIQSRERAIYEEAWALPRYSEHSPGERALTLFQEFAAPGATVLDAGCGSGRGAKALQAAGYTVVACDLTPAGLSDPWPCPFAPAALWSDLRSPLLATMKQTYVEWVYCTDVLEHVPKQFTMLAVDQMLRVATQGVFLTIATRSDEFGAFVGAVLHQTVELFPWWRDNLRELGEVVEARDLIGATLFVVRRRR